ncbi:hypothetical protein GCM10022255_114050 [Dactylosporangium darangshiense]|uniref:Uncharacterized protein n=1 Tax=Dactylosporangium darangshiense TaxID=579108 RepID=A0ABP8DW28_9ACTN
MDGNAAETLAEQGGDGLGAQLALRRADDGGHPHTLRSPRRARMPVGSALADITVMIGIYIDGAF